jgi:hypothetical protein
VDSPAHENALGWKLKTAAPQTELALRLMLGRHWEMLQELALKLQHFTPKAPFLSTLHW